MNRILSAVLLGVLTSPAFFSGAMAAEANIGDFPFECRTPDGKRLKPKYGDIEGVFYTDVPAQREACRATVQRLIAQCAENTRFRSNTQDRKYPGCREVFEEQARECAAFFRREMAKCDGGGGAGTGATGGAVDTPGAGAVLEGKGNWGLKEAGGASYVCVDSGDSSATFTWAGRCAGGEPTGKGVVGWDGGNGEGSFVDGKATGRWVQRYASGNVEEGPYVDGKRNGRWVLRYASGTVEVEEGPYVDGKRNGRWVERFANGDVSEGPYVDGKQIGRWVVHFADGVVGRGSYDDDNNQSGRWHFTRPNGSTYVICFRAGESVSCN